MALLHTQLFMLLNSLLKGFLPKMIFAFMLIFLACSSFVHAQTNISGTVKNSEGEALNGVSINIKGISKSGTTTDINGNFTLSVPSANAVLIISYVGYA